MHAPMNNSNRVEIASVWLFSDPGDGHRKLIYGSTVCRAGSTRLNCWTTSQALISKVLKVLNPPVEVALTVLRSNMKPRAGRGAGGAAASGGLLDRALVPRVEQYALNHDITDLDDVVDYLRRTYKEYGRRQLSALRQMVARAVARVQQRGVDKPELLLQVYLAEWRHKIVAARISLHYMTCLLNSMHMHIITA
jgi:Nucleolin binding domain